MCWIIYMLGCDAHVISNQTIHGYVLIYLIYKSYIHSTISMRQ
jgi:hypothetical protein